MNKRSYIHFAILLLFLVLTQSVNATKYYLSPSGNDSNNGTSPAAAWATLDKASSFTFSAGDTLFLLSGGTWSGQLIPQGSGSEGAPIVITKYGGDALPVINGPGTNNSAAIRLSNQSYWEIYNLELTNLQGTGSTDTMRLFGINIKADDATPGVNHLYIQNCYIHDVNSLSTESHSNYNKGTGAIIFTGYTNDVLVKGCKILNCKVEGIRNSSGLYCSHFVVDSNYIENVYGDGIVLHGAGDNSAITRNIAKNTCYNTSSANYAGIWTYLSKGTLVAYNEVSGIKGGGVYDGQSFDADESTDGDIFEYNYSHDNKKGFMLFMPSATNITVRYNLSIDDIGVGNNYQQRRLINNTSSNTTNKIYNNTFYIDSATDVIFQSTTSAKFSALFANNIIYSTGSVSKFATNTPNSSAIFKNNCFYPASMLTTNGPGSGSSTDENNITTDPLFNSAGGTNAFGRLNGEQINYALQSTSPCITNGTYVVADDNTQDYVGNTVTGRSFIGAIMPSDAPYYTYHVILNEKLDSAITVADTYGESSNTSTNYGSTTSMYIKAGGPNTLGTIRRGFFRFPTAQIHTDQLNNDSVQVIVRLKAYKKDNTYTTVGLSLWTVSDNNWGENTLTYANMPSLVDSITGVLNSGYSASTSNPENIDFDITDYVKNYISANGSLPAYLNFGVRAFTQLPSGTAVGNTGVNVYTKENGISDTLSPSIITLALKDSTYTTQESTTPVNASALNVQKIGKYALLNWNTYNESNTSHFIIERSSDGTTFTEIGQVAAAGYSTQLKNYSLEDYSPLAGVNYYRWQLIDNDGKIHWSNTVNINFENTTSSDFKIYPNPVKSGESLFLQLNEGTSYVKIINALGVTVKYITIPGSTSSTTISTAGLSRGIYFIQTNNASTKLYVK